MPDDVLFDPARPVEIEDIFGTDETTAQRLRTAFANIDIPPFVPQYDFTQDADEAQRAFIECDAETIRLLAPAGSGKTQSIANRVLQQCMRNGRSLNEFLILTFDNAAATALRAKMHQVLHAIARPIAGSPNVLTLNSFGYRTMRQQLGEQFHNLTLGENPENEAREIVRGILRQLRTDHPARANLLPPSLAARVYVQLIGAFKNSLVVADELAEQSAEAKDRFVELVERGLLRPWISEITGPDAEQTRRTVLNLIVFIYRSYEHELRRRSRIDFDDQKLLPYLALRGNRGLVGAIMSQVRTVIVDEFQDINRLDFEFINLISQGKQLVVVGDDDQAIYAFRGCTPDYIIDFEERSGRQTQLLVLNTNYRCPRNIVAMGNRLIAHNNRRVAKSQEAYKTHDADVQLWHCLNSASEAQVIARFVRGLHTKEAGNGLSLSDIAVLLRVNSQSLPLQIAFALEEIPYRCRREENIIASTLMENLLGLIKLHLALQTDPNTFIASDCRLFVTCMTRYASQDQISRFHRSIEACGGLSKAANSQGRVYMLDGRLRHQQFAAAVRALVTPVQTPKELISRITQHFKAMYGIVGTLEAALEDQLPLAEILDISERFRGSVQEFHDSLSRLSRSVQQGLFVEGDGDAVNLTTYFRAKGLQWHTVIIPSANQKVIPNSRAAVEDERRLFYVAITRASSNLVVSYVRKAVGTEIERSQFIGEMGLDGAVERRARSLGT